VNRLDFYDIQPKPFIREGQNRARCYARLSGGEAAEESEREILTRLVGKIARKRLR